MNRKAISPLIATFILISLTVTVGAMIVAWGRSYVQKQMECLQYRLDILGVENFTLEGTKYYLYLRVKNSGDVTIIKNIVKDRLRFIFYDDQNTEYVVYWSGTPLLLNYLEYFVFDLYNRSLEKVSLGQGEVAIFKISVSGNINRGYFILVGCDKISNDWYR